MCLWGWGGGGTNNACLQRGQNSFHIHFYVFVCFPFKWRPTPEENNFLIWEPVLSLKSRPHFESCFPWTQKRKSLKLSSAPFTRALDKREYLLVIRATFVNSAYGVTTHLNHLDKTVQVRGHNI